MRILVLVVFTLFFIHPSCSGGIGDALQTPILDPAEAMKEMNVYIHPLIRKLEYPSSAESWTRQANALRKKVLDEVVFRGAPAEWKNWHAQAEYVDTIETGKGYRIQKLRYEALPGLWIPAMLYEPEILEGQVPALFSVNGHVGAPGKAIDWIQIRCINLAKRGVLVLHPEWLSFGELQGGNWSHNNLAYLDLCGVSGLSVFYLAMRGGLDVLIDHPNVDPERVAMTGLSGGGWQTIILSSLDTRIAVSIPNAGYSGLEPRLENRGDIGDLEQNPTDLVGIANYNHLTAMLAPRPALLIYNEKDDCCFQTHRAKPSVYDPAIPFYELYGKKDLFQFHNNTDPGTHNYDLDNRQALYQFLHDSIGAGPGRVEAETHTQEEIFKPEDLYVGLPANNTDFYQLAKKIVEGFPANRSPQSPKRARGLLRNILKYEANDTTGAETLSMRTVEGIGIEFLRLHLDGGWTIPATVLTPPDPSGSVLAIAQEGRASATDQVQNLLNTRKRVVAIDLLFQGECTPGDTDNWQYSQMFATVGARPLGIQTAQLAAAGDWVREMFGDSKVDVSTDGYTSQVVALCAAALHPNRFGEIDSANGMSSLSDLFEQHTDYSKNPSLFCFGLLERFDLADLERLGVEDRITAVSSVRRRPCNELLQSLTQRLFLRR
jgi:hypothetical protein